MKPRLVLFGTSAFGLPAFRQLFADTSFDVVGVVTQPARPIGRQHIVTATPIATWAVEAGVPVVTPETLKSPTEQQVIQNLRPSCFIVASYGLILPQAVLDIPTHGAINIHASLLPQYRGASPIAAALAQGEPETGITYILMDAGCDTGPILQQTRLAVEPNEYKPSLEQRLSALAATHISDVVHGWLEGTLRPKPQPPSDAPQTKRLSRQDGKCDWNTSAVSIERRIRAYQPWPGVWTTFGRYEMKMLAATTAPENVHAPRGTVINHHGRWAVVCSEGLLLPTKIQMSGRQPQDASTIPGSYPGFVGATLS